MRVITGSARGKRLITPEGRDVRPTPDRVKEALFSALQFDIEGRRVLDLFAGSGQLGIEALSRGAEFAVLVDNSAISVRTANANVAACGFEDKARVVRSDFASFCAMSRDVFDIVFLDPPYNKGIEEKVFAELGKNLSEASVVVLETEYLPESFEGFEIIKQAKYGRVYITLYRL
mgnify:CR=1 FL=1